VRHFEKHFVIISIVSFQLYSFDMSFFHYSSCCCCWLLFCYCCYCYRYGLVDLDVMMSLLWGASHRQWCLMRWIEELQRCYCYCWRQKNYQIQMSFDVNQTREENLILLPFPRDRALTSCQMPYVFSALRSHLCSLERMIYLSNNDQAGSSQEDRSGRCAAQK